MKNYIELVRKILDQGVDVESRAGSCKMITHESLSFNLSEGFPRLTHRYVPFKSVMVELEGFLGGITSKSWYQERGCKFWNEFANPSEVDSIMLQEWTPTGEVPDPDEYNKDRNRYQLQTDDLGPIYGYQMRRFNASYVDGHPVTNKLAPEKYTGDQLNSILIKLQNNPTDRRMVVSYINPLQESQMALPPCHNQWKVDKVGDQLDLFFHMRSSDVYLGLPANIQFYAVLLHLLSRHARLKPGKVTAFLSNAHLYHNLIPQSEELVKRPEKSPCKIEFREYNKLWNWSHEDVKCIGYNHSGKLPAPVSV